MVNKKITINNNKIKHLEFIQTIIERMIKNSYLLKGWCLTVLLALITFSDNLNGSGKILFFMAVVSFYLLNFYYLYYEELYVDLYNYVRKKTGTDFSLRIQHSNKALKSALLNFPNTFFYLFLLGVVCVLNI